MKAPRLYRTPTDFGERCGRQAFNNYSISLLSLAVEVFINLATSIILLQVLFSILDFVMPASKLSGPHQTLFAFCSIFVASGAIASWKGSWSLQAFLLLPPCFQADNSTKCCQTCLGISHYEYAVYIGLPSIIAVLSVGISGLLIDIFGLPTVVIANACVNFLGNCLRVLGSYMIHNHMILAVCLTLGEIILESTTYVLVSCREYTAIRYFSGRKQAFLVGVAVGGSNLVNMVSCLVVPRIAENRGVPVGFWTLACLSLIGIIVGVILAITFHFSSSLKAFEQDIYDQKFAQRQTFQRQSSGDVIRRAKIFPIQYWLTFFAYGLSFGVQMVVETNMPALLTRLMNISAVHAGISLGLGEAAFIFVTIGTGLLLWWVGCQVTIAFFTGLMSVASLISMNFVPQIGLLTIPLYGISMICMKSMYGYYVPKESLGFAGGLFSGISLASVFFVSLIMGTILGYYKGKQGAYIALVIVSGITSVSVGILLAVWCCYGNPQTKDEETPLIKCPINDKKDRIMIIKQTENEAK